MHSQLAMTWVQTKGIKPQPKWKTTKTEDDQNGSRLKGKTTKMEDDQNGRRSKWMTTKLEDKQNGRQPKWKRNHTF